MDGRLSDLIDLVMLYNAGKTKSDFDSPPKSVYPKKKFFGSGYKKVATAYKFVCFKKKFFGSSYKKVAIARKTRDWFEYLSEGNFDKLLLVYQSVNSVIPEHKLAGMVGGGGDWFIEARNSDFSDFWQEVRCKNSNAWNVTYGLTIPNQKQFDHPKYDINVQKQKLKTALSKIADFAAANENTSSWEEIFNNAKATLESEITDSEYYQTLSPKGSSLKENLQLLIAAQESWVFGGMGSWNDFSFRDDEELAKKYDEVSAELYQAINESFIVAVNGN
jgi:hypothetical protein